MGIWEKFKTYMDAPEPDYDDEDEMEEEETEQAEACQDCNSRNDKYSFFHIFSCKGAAVRLPL